MTSHSEMAWHGAFLFAESAEPFRCPGRALSPCHNDEWMLVARLTAGEVVPAFYYRCKNCRLPVGWDQKSGQWAVLNELDT